MNNTSSINKSQDQQPYNKATLRLPGNYAELDFLPANSVAWFGPETLEFKHCNLALKRQHITGHHCVIPIGCQQDFLSCKTALAVLQSFPASPCKILQSFRASLQGRPACSAISLAVDPDKCKISHEDMCTAPLYWHLHAHTHGHLHAVQCSWLPGTMQCMHAVMIAIFVATLTAQILSLHRASVRACHLEAQTLQHRCNFTAPYAGMLSSVYISWTQVSKAGNEAAYHGYKI